MPKDNYITGIDVGSHYITALIASVSGDFPTPKIIGAGRAHSSGIRKGVIVDLDDAINCVKKAASQAQQSADVTMQSAYVSIGGAHITAAPSKGVIGVSRADGQISIDDVERVITASSTVALPANQEILHNLPHEFIIDGMGGLRDVVGMNGLRLEANTLILHGSSAHLKTLDKCMEENDIDVDGYVISPIAASRAVLTKRQKELGVACIDIGGCTTDIAVYEEGNLIYSSILPIGGDNITNDLAIGLRVGVDTAERVKREYGMARASDLAQKRDAIDLSQIDPNEKEVVLRKDVVEIMEARLNEIFELVNKSLKKIGKEAYLPAGIVLVGGSAKIPHIVDLCRDKLRLATQIGFPNDVEAMVGSVDDPSYAAALGLIFWGIEEGEFGGFSIGGGLSSVNNSVDSVKKWLRNLLP